MGSGNRGRVPLRTAAKEGEATTNSKRGALGRLAGLTRDKDSRRKRRAALNGKRGGVKFALKFLGEDRKSGEKKRAGEGIRKMGKKKWTQTKSKAANMLTEPEEEQRQRRGKLKARTCNTRKFVFKGGDKKREKTKRRDQRSQHSGERGHCCHGKKNSKREGATSRRERGKAGKKTISRQPHLRKKASAANLRQKITGAAHHRRKPKEGEDTLDIPPRLPPKGNSPFLLRCPGKKTKRQPVRSLRGRVKLGEKEKVEAQKKGAHGTFRSISRRGGKNREISSTEGKRRKCGQGSWRKSNIQGKGPG